MRTPLWQHVETSLDPRSVWGSEQSCRLFTLAVHALPPLPACICLESACFCLYILKPCTVFVLHTRRDERACVAARKHVKALDGRYYDECCLAQWCPGWVSPGHVSGKGHCMIHSRCLAHTPSNDGSESEQRERIRDGDGGVCNDGSDTNTQRERFRGDIKTEKENNRPLTNPIHHSSSLPEHPKTHYRHRHLKREVLMSSMEMLTFR